MAVHDADSISEVCESNQSEASPHRRLRILMVSPRYYPYVGGIETHIHEVGRRLVSRGHSVTLLTTDVTGKHPKEEFVAGLTVYRVRAWPEAGDWYFAPEIYRRIVVGKWDVVHIQGYHTFVAPLALLAAIRKSVPFVVTFHSGGHSSRLRLLMRRAQHMVLRPMISRAHRLIAVSNFEADFFSEVMRLPRELFVVIPNGAQLPHVARNDNIDKRPLIVSVGRLERYKGHHKAIAALPELHRYLPHAKLRILGEGPYKKQLHSLVQALALEEHVSIGGIAADKRDELASLLCSAGLVVLLSDYEAHPVAVMEALSLGRRVLVSDTSGLRELAEKGFCRAVSSTATPRNIAEAMRDELKNDRAVPALTLPDWGSCADDLLQVYESVAYCGK